MGSIILRVGEQRYEVFSVGNEVFIKHNGEFYQVVYGLTTKQPIVRKLGTPIMRRLIMEKGVLARV